MSLAKDRVAFVFPAFPVLHQTFVLWEVLALRRQGLPIEIYSLKRPSTTTQQPEGASLAAEVHYLPSTFSAPVLRDNLRVFVRSPRRYIQAFVRLTRAWWQDRDAKSLWRDPSSGRGPGESLVTLRERAEEFFNENPFVYLLKSLWLVFGAVHLGCELERAGIRRVHAHWASYSTTMALVIHWLFDLPFSFSAHAYDIYLVPRLLSVKVREAEFAVTCARVNKRVLEALAGRGAGKVIVNYHGVDLDRFRRRLREPSPSVTCIVTCGRLQLYKGHHVLLQACARLRTPFRCVIIGEGPQRATLEQMAISLGIGDHVEFTGPLPQQEVVRCYEGATLFVLSSVVVEGTGKRDVIPNVLAEAMAMGIPVIATDVSGIGELIVDGASGRLIPSNDPEALARAIEELSNDPVERRRLAEGGYRKVADDFDRARNIVDLVRLFRAEESSASGASAAAAAG